MQSDELLDLVRVGATLVDRFDLGDFYAARGALCRQVSHFDLDVSDGVEVRLQAPSILPAQARIAHELLQLFPDEVVDAVPALKQAPSGRIGFAGSP
jgi:hypothetical protein